MSIGLLPVHLQGDTCLRIMSTKLLCLPSKKVKSLHKEKNIYINSWILEFCLSFVSNIKIPQLTSTFLLVFYVIYFNLKHLLIYRFIQQMIWSRGVGDAGHWFPESARERVFSLRRPQRNWPLGISTTVQSRPSFPPPPLTPDPSPSPKALPPPPSPTPPSLSSLRVKL